MPECVRCQSNKDASEFYAKDRTCKECRKELVRANRAAKIEHYREFDRQRANLPHRVEARLAYQATERGREAVRRANRSYLSRNPRIRASQVAVNNAIRDGILVPPPVCLNLECMKPGPVEGHHTSYDHPLGVDWLCRECHVAVHDLHRRLERQSASEQ